MRVTDMSLFVPLLSIADGVASSAGSQLISECIFANVPLLALYSEKDGEQMLNIEMSKHLFDGKNTSLTTSKSNNSTTQDGSQKIKKIVHGISKEKFLERNSILLEGTKRSNLRTTTSETSEIKNDFGLRNKTRIKASLQGITDEFNSYVESINNSNISWTFYNDFYRETFQSDRGNNDHNEEAYDEDESDPFQGMPEVSAVIMEIIKELKKEKQ